MEIDASSPEHTYLQLAGLLRERIRSGEIVSQVPSITELTEQTGLAVGTVRRAIKVLADEGLVRTVPGRGTYVTERRDRPAGGRAGGKVPARPDAGGAGLTRSLPPHGHVRH